mmetsp:Transcript_37743/g.57794  ORF Transcript_37743/g.57794 Transcript_37743/m.57794 type:complete len:93 (-) Transcript_37743:172-450(-)
MTLQFAALYCQKEYSLQLRLQETEEIIHEKSLARKVLLLAFSFSSIMAQTLTCIMLIHLSDYWQTDHALALINIGNDTYDGHQHQVTEKEFF